MYKAGLKDKNTVIHILRSALENDPHTNWYVTGSTRAVKNQHKFISFLKYNFMHALIQGEVSISDNDEGCALWVNYGKPNISFKMFLENLKFLFIFGYKHTKEVIIMQQYIKNQYTQKSFLHLLFLGVVPEHQKKGIASSLLNPVLNNARGKQIPVLLETSTKTNVIIYKRKGFKVYHTWEVPFTDNLQISFMQTDSKSSPVVQG